MTHVSSSPNVFTRFFSNPIVGVTGSVASVLGVIVAFYFYFDSQDYRELRYFVHPARAVVIKAGETSRLSITLDEKPVKRDVSAVQIAFWNEGDKSIRRENVLHPLIIRTGPEFPILEAEIRKKSREVIEVKLDQDRMDVGEIEVDWNILEKHDGAILQLVYLGDTQLPVIATSIIEGQGKIEGKEYSGKIESASEQYSAISKSNMLKRIIGFIYIAGSLSILVFGLIAFRKTKSGSRSLRYITLTLSIVISLFIFTLSLLLILKSNEIHGPPFGF